MFRITISLLVLAAGFLLLKSGIYGYTLFVFGPTVIGGLGVWVSRPPTMRRALLIGAFMPLFLVVWLLLLGQEGLFCIAMALPLALPLGALGGALAFRSITSHAASRGLALLLLLPPGGIAWDLTARPDLYPVRTAIEIAAPPATVWKHVVTFSELPPPKEWFFRAGVAYPKRARIVGSGPGAVRYCEFSTGPFVEPIQVWDEPRLLKFRVTQNPEPMQEFTYYERVAPKHLHGYLVSRQGQFRLTALPGGRTRLEGTTWYQHGLWPGQYWRWWSDAIIHRIHLRVLNHIAALAQKDNARGDH